MAQKRAVNRKKRQATLGKPLSAREKQVLRLISLGCSVKEAAAVLKLAPSTVDNHKANAMRKLGANKVALVTRLVIKRKISNLSDRLTPLEKRRSGRKNDGWN